MPLKIQRDDEISINLTPMIDIVFLLIIFFMVSTRFTELDTAERDLAVQVPRIGNAAASASPAKPQIINVYSDGSVSLGEVSMSLDELAQRMRAEPSLFQQAGVVIRGDGQSRYQQVAEVIATCRQADITNLNISVRPAERR